MTDTSRKIRKRKKIPALFFIVCLILLAITSILFFLNASKPVLTRMVPSVAKEGDVVVLEGRHFGDEKGDSAVEIAGSTPTQSNLLFWSDTQIRFRVPVPAESGLVHVKTGYGSSNGMLFTDRSTIPVKFNDEMSQSAPYISAVTPSSGIVGESIAITGINFGTSRGMSEVLFSWYAEPANRENSSDEFRLKIAGPYTDFVYDSWSDKELHVRIPDGAVSGAIAVHTEKGVSNTVAFDVTGKPGIKQFRDEKTYVLESRIDVTNIKGKPDSGLWFWVPRPLDTSNQRGVQVLTASAIPVLEEYNGLDLFYFKDFANANEYKLAESFLVHVFSLECQIKPDLIRISKTPSPLEAVFSRADSLVPSDSPEIRKAANLINRGEYNPYRAARRIYDWMVSSFSVTAIEGPAKIEDALAQKRGDAWSAVILYCAMLRSQGFAAAPVSGYLLEAKMTLTPHFWAEVWIPGFGWFPVDPVLGSGARPGSYIPHANPADYYFGTCDNRHIAFSRGLNTLTRVAPDGKTVSRKRFYSFQDIFEESSSSVISYSAYWGDIVILGIY